MSVEISDIMSMISCFQTIITQINHAIGASGIVSQECKAVVDQYGKIILELLLAQVYNYDNLYDFN